jgi:hypothetical protein
LLAPVVVLLVSVLLVLLLLLLLLVLPLLVLLLLGPQLVSARGSRWSHHLAAWQH